MKVFRIYFDGEKEIKWLNEMSEKGLALTNFFLGFYTFEECEKGKYQYQEDTTSTLFKVTDEYREFMNGAGIDIVAVWGPWVILRREAEEGEFELYSDNTSKIEHQKKILKIFKAVTILELICFFMEVISGSMGNRFALGFSVIIGLFILIFCIMIFKTKERLNALREEEGIAAKCRSAYSPVLLAGNFLYLLSFAIDAEASEFMHYIKMTVMILACAFMLTGVYITMRNTREQNKN